MTVILHNTTKEQLRVKAAQSGVSMCKEAGWALQAWVESFAPPKQPSNVFTSHPRNGELLVQQFLDLLYQPDGARERAIRDMIKRIMEIKQDGKQKV